MGTPPILCQLDAQIAGKTLFLCVSVRMSLEEISIFISRLNKQDHPHQCLWASTNMFRVWIKQKAEKGQNCYWLELGYHYLFLSLDVSAPGSQTFWLGLNYTTSHPGSPVCRQQTDLLLASLFLWRTLIHLANWRILLWSLLPVQEWT